MSEPLKACVFPEPIRGLPQADVPLAGVTAYLSQSDNHQILFMTFEEDVEVPEHSHGPQWSVVLEGRIELVIGGVENVFTKGDRYFIAEGVRHSGFIHAGYADISWFGDKGRYRARP